MAYVQIFMIVKARAHRAGILQILQTHGITSEPAPETLAPVDLPADCDVLRLRTPSKYVCDHGDCQCPTVLGRLVLKALDTEKRELEKKGWSQDKIQRWQADVEKDRGARDDADERDRWIGCLQDLVASGITDEVGLLAHESPAEPKPHSPIAIAESLTCPIQTLTPETIDSMKREILYRFTS
jgi:hypothetical protein